MTREGREARAPGCEMHSVVKRNFSPGLSLSGALAWCREGDPHASPLSEAPEHFIVHV